jgi:hypothetical protein
MKIGRNDPCPCGSGRKYKHCFLRNVCERSPWPPDVRSKMQAQMMAEHQRRQKFGEVRPIIHAEHQGRRLVAVGSRIIYDRPGENKRWNTFIDVLMAYIRLPLGSGWGKRELLKPLADRHPVMQWYDHVCNLQKNTARLEANGLYSMQMDGVTSAFLHLAYDLYVLDDHQKLQKEVLKRLRRRENFAGARYELLVAATFIRAACSIAFEDERDSSRRHPEFVATYRETGFVFSVEAKARQRTVGISHGDTRLKAGVRDLLLDAATKETMRPYVVFVDVNLPPDDPKGPPTWAEEVTQTARDVVAQIGHCPFDLIVFTNIPHHYSEVGGPDPAKHMYFWLPKAFRPSRLPPVVEAAIVRAASQYDNIPQDLPAA